MAVSSVWIEVLGRRLLSPTPEAMSSQSARNKGQFISQNVLCPNPLMNSPFTPEPSRIKLLGQLIYFLAWAGLSSIGAFILHPDIHNHGTHTQLGLPPCPSVVLFGRPCPGCGLTTSWTHLLHGQIPEAFGSHALGPFLYLAFTMSALLSGYGYARRARYDMAGSQYDRWVGSMVAVFLAYGVARFATTTYKDAAAIAVHAAIQQASR